jgi:hypothetical protein
VWVVSVAAGEKFPEKDSLPGRKGGKKVRLGREKGNDPWLAPGSRTDPRLVHILGQEEGKRMFGAFCAVQRCLGAVGEIGGSSPTLRNKSKYKVI